MIQDIISKRLYQIDNYARDASGNINENDKLNQFIDNLIYDASLDPSCDEDYIDYSVHSFNNHKGISKNTCTKTGKYDII